MQSQKLFREGRLCRLLGVRTSNGHCLPTRPKSPEVTHQCESSPPLRYVSPNIYVVGAHQLAAPLGRYTRKPVHYRGKRSLVLGQSSSKRDYHDLNRVGNPASVKREKPTRFVAYSTRSTSPSPEEVEAVKRGLRSNSVSTLKQCWMATTRFSTLEESAPFQWNIPGTYLERLTEERESRSL